MNDQFNQSRMENGDRSGHLELVPLLLAISKKTRALLRLRLTEVQFHNGQDELILALDPESAMGVADLAEVLCIRPATASKMIDRLSSRGLLDRSVDPSDNRRALIRLSDKGKTWQVRLLSLRERLEAELAAEIENGEVGDLHRALAITETTLRKRLSRIR